MLWGLFGSEKRVEEALAQSTANVDLSPDAHQPANNNEIANQDAPKPRMWIEDWTEKDEARLRDPETSFGITWL